VCLGFSPLVDGQPIEISRSRPANVPQTAAPFQSRGEVRIGKPYFDGIIFHRVIPNFMLQTGDPLGKGTGGPGYNFADEVKNGLSFEPGSMAMANSGPSTNGSQFFITEVATKFLNDKHTIFGKCAEIDLVKKIAGVPKVCDTCNRDDPRAAKPKSDVTIKKITFSRG
jgi:peptidyl-prolyl cis-trans isomerase A (cyclophilin A)